MKKDVILEEIKKDLNWKERIIVRMFSNLFIKLYNKTRLNIVNRLMQF